MKRTEIRRRIRYNIRETTANLWTNTELNDHIDTAQKEVAAVLHPSYNPDLASIHSVSAATGTANYDLPGSFLKMLGNADLASETYVVTPLDYVRPIIIGDYAYVDGKNICYERENDLYLYPVPTASEDNKLISYPYMTVPANFSDDTTTDGALSAVAYSLVIDKASAMALMKLDSEEGIALAKRFFDKYDMDLKRLNEAAR